MITFDDQIIMDVPDDEAISEDLHSIAENVVTDCLDDILHGLGGIGFNAFPFLCGARALQKWFRVTRMDRSDLNPRN